MPKQIIKRAGDLEAWDLKKIETVISKALESSDIKSEDVGRITKELSNMVASEYKWKRLIPQEEVQDSIEKILMSSGYIKAARNFILYREKRRIVREEGQLQLDVMHTMGDYIDRGDWRVKENSNIQFSFGGLILYTAETVQAKYCLNQYPESIRDAHSQGFVHIHDLGFGLAPYCSGWSLEDLLLEGFNNPGYSSSDPPKNFTTALNQMVNFLGTLQNEWSGAQAFNSIDTYLAPFIYYNKLSYKEVYDGLQSFVFGLNITSRWAAQSPFSNVSLDVACPKYMKNQPAIIGGELKDKTYGEFEKEMGMFNRAFVEVLLKGDRDGAIFSYPIPAYNITEDFPWDTEFGDILADLTGKYGTPYFQNFINSDLNPEDVRSMCPLTGDTKVLVKINSYLCDWRIRRIYAEAHKAGGTVDVWSGSSWVSAIPTQVPLTTIYRVTVDVGADINIDMGENHLQPVYNQGNVQAKDLEVGMLLPFDKNNKLLPYAVLNTASARTPDFEDDDFVYYVIKNIEVIDPGEDTELYCFEVYDDSHLFMLSNKLITHNCRLRLDKREVIKKVGGLFGSGNLTGSIQVVTINLARLGYMARDEEEFLDLVKHYSKVAKDCHEIKRKMLEYNLKHNMFPWTKRYLKNGFKGHFSTIGVCGGHEACLNLLGRGIDSSEGKILMIKTLNMLKDLTSIYQESTGNLYNLEATPAEGCTYRFAKLDKAKYPDIIQSGGDIPYYTNSTALPVDKEIDVIDALNHQSDIEKLYTGGVVFHTFLGESVIDRDTVKDYIMKVCRSTELPFISLTPTFSICRNHGYIRGEHNTCPQCGEGTDVYSRIVGYYRRISNWNISKQTEFKDRKVFKI